MTEYFVPPAPPPPPPVIPSAQTAFDSPISAPASVAPNVTASYTPTPPPAPPCPYSGSPPQTISMGPPVAPPPPPPGPPTFTASPAHTASPSTVTVEPRKPQIPLMPISDARSDLLAAIRRGKRKLSAWKASFYPLDYYRTREMSNSDSHKAIHGRANPGNTLNALLLGYLLLKFLFFARKKFFINPFITVQALQ